MKKIRSTPQLIAAFVAAFLSIQSVHAAPTWANAAGGNWSVPGNWSPSGVPGTISDVIFGNTGVGFPTTNDISSLTINSLTYNQNNQTTATPHTTVLNPGQTLTVNSSGAANTALLYVGNTTTTASEQVNAAIQGLTSTLTLNGLGDIWVMQGVGASGANGSHHALLDLTQLGTLNATIGRLYVGVNVNGVNRHAGTMLLAQTNVITCTGAIPQVEVGQATANGNSGGTPANNTGIGFGQKTSLFADTMRLGGDKCAVLLNFAAALNTAPTLKIRNADGVNPCTVIDFGYANGNGGTGTTEGMAADFSLGSVDLLANLVHMPQGQPGPGTGTATATVTLGAGTFAVADLEIGYGNCNTAATTGNTTGTLNVNNNGLFAAGAVVKCSTVMNLARTNTGGTGTVINGVVNVNGGTVLANTITSGGGVSTFRLNTFSPNSALVVSNTAGTLSLPIRFFTMNDAILTIPALNGGAVVAVSNLTVGGSVNVINISSIPPIGSYPADFTLINYLSGYTAGTGPLSLGTLPAGGYSGTLVDTGGGVIKLHLTAGPVVNLGMHWTGATDNNWDFTTFNWTFLGVSTNFFNGSSPLFDDATSQTNVVLTTTLSPGSITVSNNTKQFTFVDIGNLAGVGTLTKKGSASLIVANQGVNTIGTVVIGSGTLQIGTNDLNGEISAISITNSGALVVSRSGSYNLSAAISGTGTLTKNGNGTLILPGANSYSGTTTLSNGTLQIDGTSSGSGPLTTSPGTVLAGSGTVSGAVTVRGQMNPGPTGLGGMGIFNANGGLTLNSGSTLFFDLSAANPAISDSINVVGNLNVNNNAITVSFDGPPAGGSYTLFTYTGSLSGSFNTNIVGTHFTMTLDTNTPGFVYLNVIGGSGSDLSWASMSDSTWDQSTTNWLDVGSSLPSTFNNGDTVLLDDTAGVVPGITIPSGVNVAPTSITDNATNNSFIISGAGHITGSSGIVKSGLANLTINTVNTFSGLVDVQAGTLQVGNAAALGTIASGTTVEDGATLDLNAQNIGGEAIGISGSGNGGIGALINSGGASPGQALRTLILNADATIGGSGPLLMNNSGGNATVAGAFNLTKTGTGQLTWQNVITVDIGLKNIDIQQGIMEFNGFTASMGDATYTNIVESGARVSFVNSFAWNKQFDFTGDGSTTTVNIAAGSATTLVGPVVLHGDVVFAVGGTSLTITNTISGDGGVIKNGGSPLILTGPTTYTGDTTINGTSSIRLVAPADLSGSTNIVINSGAFLTVTGMAGGIFPLASDHTLRGHGVISGALTANAGSTVSPAVTPGVSPAGVLTVSNAIILSGTTIIELDPANATNDVLKSGLSTITYGGNLSLTNLSSLTGGDSFKIFSASSYLGSFSSITPTTPGPGQTWDTSALGTTGTIKVVTTTPPTFSGIMQVGTTVVMSGSNGTALSPYYVLTSTNLAVPFTNWTQIGSNSFDGTGHFAFTNSLIPTLPQRFYLIKLP